jgi:transcriptional regulator with XRE-family HTH domain
MNHSPRYRQFRALLRQIRIEAGLSKEALSKRLGKAATFISKCELGERRVQFLEAFDICENCGVSMEEFCSRLRQPEEFPAPRAARQKKRGPAKRSVRKAVKS